MPKAKPLTKQQILGAMGKTRSNKAAARYLGVSYIHYKKWAKNYEATQDGYKNLFEQHLNPSGKGIPKFLSHNQKDFNILDVCEGRISHTHFKPQKIKEKLIVEGYLEEKCTRCGFQERRVIDYRMPLIFNFKDANKNNYQLDNLELLCYNCYYLYVGEVFNDKQIEGLEEHREVFSSSIDWEMDEYTKQRLEELGLVDKKDLSSDWEALISKG